VIRIAEPCGVIEPLLTMSPDTADPAPLMLTPAPDWEVMVPLLVITPLSVVALVTAMPVAVPGEVPVAASLPPVALVTAPVWTSPSLKTMQSVVALLLNGVVGLVLPQAAWAAVPIASAEVVASRKAARRMPPCRAL
jgi:hypothetical protein